MEKSVWTLARRLWGSVRGVEPVVGRGSVNQVYQVSTEKGSFILRCRRDAGALSEYRKEHWCMEAARGSGICVPQRLGEGIYEDGSYAAEIFYEGVHGECASRIQQERILLVLGKYARRLHTVQVEGFGTDLSEPGRFTDRFSKSFAEQLAYHLRMLMGRDPVAALGAYPCDDVPRVASVFQFLWRNPPRMGLCHGDLSLKNTLLRPDGTVMLLDFGCARVHAVPYTDFDCAQLPTWGRELFWHGYGMACEKRTLRAIVLLNRFDLLRWAMGHLPSADIGPYLQCAKKAFEGLEG